jgi:hypothetical protein
MLESAADTIPPIIVLSPTFLVSRVYTGSQNLSTVSTTSKQINLLSEHIRHRLILTCPGVHLPLFS